MANNKQSKSYRLTLFLKGAIMGLANKIPGVSGGTVSFVLGFYEEFIYSLQKFNYKSIILLINGRFSSFFKYININFLFFLFLGSIFSYFSVSRLLEYLLKHYELYVWSMFWGLILGSVIYICRSYKKWSLINIIFIIIGLFLGLSLNFIKTGEENTNLLFVFLCGIISICGMVLPGLSGSYLLLIIGNYSLLLVDSVNAVYDTSKQLIMGDTSFLNNEKQIKYLYIAMSFTLGSLIGLVVLSKILAFAFKKWRNKITAIIIGFIIGSLTITWPWKEKIYITISNKTTYNYKKYFPDINENTTYIAFFIIIISIFLVLITEHYAKKNK